MKRLHSSLAFLLSLCLLLGALSGCGKTSKPSDKPGDDPGAVEPQVTGRESYETAAAALRAVPNLVMKILVTEEKSVGTETVTEKVDRKAQYQNLGGEDMIADVSETLYLGRMRANCRQVYADGSVYVSVRDSRYYSKETADAFLSGQIPAVLLDASRYGSVTEEITTDGKVIHFTEAESAEEWSMPAGATLLFAEGTATLSAEGALLAMRYDIQYQFGGAAIHAQVKASVETPDELDLSGSVPEDAGDYQLLGSVDAALILLRASAAMERANVMSINSSETVYSEALGAYRVQSDTQDCYKRLLSEKHTNQTVDLSTQETYSDSYSVTYDDGKLVYTYKDGTDESVEWNCSTTAEYVRLSAMDYFPRYSDLAGAQITEVGDYYLIDYTGTDSLGDRAEDAASLVMFYNRDFLDDYATKYTTKYVKGTVAVEKATFLPVSSTMNYAGFHTIQGISYGITMETNLSVSLYDPDAYEAITGEPLPDEEPATRPTPVFYEVTGKNGEHMYLFGTIHVGDDRTAFLPQTITDAFDSADALAVEFDTQDFNDNVTNDEELMELVAQAYYYTDGTDISDHLDAEIYEEAVNWMKVAGNHSSTAERMKPFVWSSIIENFFLSQGRKLSASKGMDNRLLRLARETGKEILNVESGVFQIQTLSGYSDPVQEMMLAGTIAYSREEYLQSIYDLFECWCQGNEKTLSEKLAAISEEERAELSEDELAVYEEYHQKMEVDRNAGMLEVAKGYLQSEKTVFYAVGLAHLLGEGGLVESLRANGYTVTLITEP